MYAGLAILGDVRDECLRVHALETICDELGMHTVLKTASLQPLGIEYRRYIWNRIPEPDEWESTSIFMQYLAMDVVELRLLGFQPRTADRAEWGLCILFSSCGGSSSVSAWLAAHWAGIWYHHDKRRICDDFLIPFGFVPSDSAARYTESSDVEIPATQNWTRTQTCPLFVPVGSGSYASFRPNRKLATGESPFQLNCALADELEDGGRQLLADLESFYGDDLADGRCRCQLCAPDLHPNGVRCHPT